MDALLEKFHLLEYKDRLIKDDFTSVERLAFLKVQHVAEMGINSRFALSAFEDMLQYLKGKADSETVKSTAQRSISVCHFCHRVRTSGHSKSCSKTCEGFEHCGMLKMHRDVVAAEREKRRKEDKEKRDNQKKQEKERQSRLIPKCPEWEKWREENGRNYSENMRKLGATKEALDFTVRLTREFAAEYGHYKKARQEEREVAKAKKKLAFDDQSTPAPQSIEIEAIEPDSSSL